MPWRADFAVRTGKNAAWNRRTFLGPTWDFEALKMASAIRSSPRFRCHPTKGTFKKGAHAGDARLSHCRGEKRTWRDGMVLMRIWGEKAPKSGISCAAVSGNGPQGVHTRTLSGTKQEASEKCFKFLQEWDLFDFQGHNILSTISYAVANLEFPVQKDRKLRQPCSNGFRSENRISQAISVEFSMASHPGSFKEVFTCHGGPTLPFERGKMPPGIGGRSWDPPGTLRL
jgi:hypothetical protein